MWTEFRSGGGEAGGGGGGGEGVVLAALNYKNCAIVDIPKSSVAERERERERETERDRESERERGRERGRKSQVHRGSGPRMQNALNS